MLAVAVKRSRGNIVNRVETEHDGGKRESAMLGEMTVHCFILCGGRGTNYVISTHSPTHTYANLPKLNLSSLVKLLFLEMFQRFVFRVGRSKLGP